MSTERKRLTTKEAQEALLLKMQGHPVRTIAKHIGITPQGMSYALKRARSDAEGCLKKMFEGLSEEEKEKRIREIALGTDCMQAQKVIKSLAPQKYNIKK